MNKQTIYQKFKKATFKKSFIEGEKLAFYTNFFKDFDSKPAIQKGLTFDLSPKSIKDYDRINGDWFKTNLCFYEFIK